MPKYLVHYARTEFYDVPVEAADEDEAFELSSEIMGPEHLDRKSVVCELAEWCDPIEEIDENEYQARIQLS